MPGDERHASSKNYRCDHELAERDAARRELIAEHATALEEGGGVGFVADLRHGIVGFSE